MNTKTQLKNDQVLWVWCWHRPGSKLVVRSTPTNIMSAPPESCLRQEYWGDSKLTKFYRN